LPFEDILIIIFKGIGRTEHLLMNDISHDTYFEKILTSHEFSSSKTDRALFEYLYDSSKKGKDLDEITIAVDVFDRGPDFDPADDTVVRVHKYSLRKKLKIYYLTEGKNDEIKFEIPKGEYRLVIKQRKKPKTANNPVWHKKLLKHFTYTGILVLLGAILYLFIINLKLTADLSSYKSIEKNHPIWQDFFERELPILVVLGNHFTFQEMSKEYDRVRIIRDTRINSPSDLEAFKEEYTVDNIINSDPKTYFPFHSVWGLVPVLNTLYSFHVQPVIKKSSDVTTDMFQEFNILFIGSIKTLYNLEHIFSQSNLQYQLDPHKIIYTPPNDTVSFEYMRHFDTSFPNRDLGLALKLPGPADNTIFIITSFHSMGVPSIINYLNNKQGTEELLEYFGTDQFPRYFETLFRITGIEKTVYNLETLICNDLTTRFP
jgi:hypothetical protein